MAKNTSKSPKRIKTVFAVFAVACVVLAFCAFIRNQYNALISVERRIAAATREIEAQEARAISLEREKAMRGTDEYYEKIAREQLGLVYKNEIIFKKRK